MNLSKLTQLDGLRFGAHRDVPLWLHNDHRWTLPLIVAAQEQQFVPRPCHLIVFDRHHDALTPNCQPELERIRSVGPTIDNLITLCEKHLRTLDDDWIKAAMELGLVEHAIVFGVEDRDLRHEESRFNDHRGGYHRIILSSLPGESFGYQGDLSDLARGAELQELWNILGWKPIGGKFSFADGRPKAFVTMDLDCFIISWRDYLLPWPEEVYIKTFLTISTYGLTQGWSGKKFVEGLLASAGVLDIAREPDCCGGDTKADKVLSDLNLHLFNGDLNFSSDRQEGAEKRPAHSRVRRPTALRPKTRH
jgi:hypothetical protein